MSAIPFDEIRHWMFEAALPLWAERGVDRAQGGFIEELDFTAKPAASAFKRTRVACRQIYVFSHAAMLGWARGEEIAAAGQAHLQALYLGSEKGWPRKLNPNNSVSDETPDLYDLAFVLFAFAWRHKAARDGAALAYAHRTLDFIEAHMRAPHGGFHHALPPEGPRLQNPHMHLFEASLVAFEASGEARFLNVAREIADLFARRFFDGRTLGEFFNADWTRLPGEEGRAIEPGHQLEWAWILGQYKRFTGAGIDAQATALVDFAETFGVDRASGAARQAVRDDGVVLDASSRAWPNTERIKGHLALFELNGFDASKHDPRPAVAQSARLLLDRYLATDVPGLWIDHFDAAGAPLSKSVPASTFYHVFLAFAEALRLERELKAIGG